MPTLFTALQTHIARPRVPTPRLAKFPVESLRTEVLGEVGAAPKAKRKEVKNPQTAPVLFQAIDLRSVQLKVKRHVAVVGAWVSRAWPYGL